MVALLGTIGVRDVARRGAKSKDSSPEISKREMNDLMRENIERECVKEGT